MEGKEIRATPLSSSLPSALLSARGEQGRGKEDHAPPSTGYLGVNTYSRPSNNHKTLFRTR